MEQPLCCKDCRQGKHQESNFVVSQSAVAQVFNLTYKSLLPWLVDLLYNFIN